MDSDRYTLINIEQSPSGFLIPRSRLYHLAPIGAGTPYAESLTSYILRLADAHCVTSQTLMSKEVIPLLRKGYLKTPRRFLMDDSRTFNGVTQYAKSVVKVLETLTMRKSLQYHTMSKWAGVVDPAGKGLLKKERTWCPHCYEEWAANGNTIYDPLIWSIRGVSRCDKHMALLLSQCPKCRRRQPFLLSRAGVGHCYHCDRWLGVNLKEVEQKQIADWFLKKMMWMYLAVGEMIAAAPTLDNDPSSLDLTEALKRYAGLMAEGNLSELGRRIKMTPHTIRQWVRGRYRPRFDSLLDLCYRLNVTPVKLLYGTLEDCASLNLRTSSPQIKRKVRKSKEPAIKKEVVQALLEKILAWKRPSSIPKIAKKLGCKDWTLRYHFPGLCREIAEKRKLRKIALRKG